MESNKFVTWMAQAYWEAIEEKIIQVINNAIAQEIDIDKEAELQYQEDLKQHELAKKEIAEKVDKETADELTPPKKVELKTITDVFNFWYNCLVKKDLLLQHTVEPNWEIVVKIYKLKKETKGKVKTSFKVS